MASKYKNPVTKQSLLRALSNNRPTGVTNAQIDAYMGFYFNNL